MNGFSRLRIELPDHPGALAAVSRVLATAGLNVVEVVIHEVDGQRAVDEIVVHGGEPLDSAGLSRALAGVGGDLLSVAPCDMRGDPTVTALTWVTATADTPARRSSLATGVRLLTGIEPAVVVTAEEARAWPIGLAALRRGLPVVQRLARPPEPLHQEAADETSGVWVLAAPDAPDASLVVLAARPYAIRFTATELSRLVSVLDCRRRLLANAPQRLEWSGGLASNA